jgi:hypothetical protein
MTTVASALVVETLVHPVCVNSGQNPHSYSKRQVMGDTCISPIGLGESNRQRSSLNGCRVRHLSSRKAWTLTLDRLSLTVHATHISPYLHFTGVPVLCGVASPHTRLRRLCSVVRTVALDLVGYHLLSSLLDAMYDHFISCSY